MTAYYNEIDPYAAQWLRNLIDASRLARQDKAKDLQIPATCGRSGWS